MADPIACRELHEVQLVPMRVQPHRLGVDRDDAGEVDFGREIAVVKMNAHNDALCPGEDRTSTSFRPQA
jgi:hypothetical protein